MISFHISEYVDWYIDKKYTLDMLEGEVDDLEDSREVLTKNVQKLLKEFKEYRDTFDIENNLVFQYFPLEFLSKEEQYQFLSHLIEIKNDEGGIGNKVIYNLKKITSDLEDDRFDKLLLKEPEIGTEGLQALVKLMVQVNEWNRDIISNDWGNVKMLMDWHQERASIIGELGDTNRIFFLLATYRYSITQSVMHWVACCDCIHDDKKVEILQSLKEYLIHFQGIVREEKKNKNRTYSLETILPIFTSILKIRNHGGKEWKLNQVLHEEQENDSSYFQPVPEEYHADKNTPIAGVNLKHFLNEGPGRCDDFEEKLAQTKELIQRLEENDMWGVSSNSLLDLKVYYRELYICKSKYKIRVTNTVRKWLSPYEETPPLSELVFLQHKISRGYFREEVPIEYFNMVNEISYLVEVTMIEILLCYDLEEILHYSSLMNLTMHRLAFSGIKEVCHIDWP